MSEFFLQRYRRIDPSVTTEGIEPKQALRVNTARVMDRALVAALRKNGATVEKIPFLRHGYYAHAEFSLGATPEYLLGHYYLQAPLSQLACELLDPKEIVLDMAAAPGGKTTYFAQMGTTVVALDDHPGRLASVRNNAERLGLPSVLCVQKDARFADDLGKKFPYVLLDAPCSGNFCSEEEWFGKRTIDDVRKNARLQKELLRAAFRCLEPGGRLVYSTCSLEPEENECVVDWALRTFADLDVLPIETDIGDPGTTSWDGELDPRTAMTKRFWPHKTGCEGFYIALLQRKVGRR